MSNFTNDRIEKLKIKNQSRGLEPQNIFNDCNGQLGRRQKVFSGPLLECKQYESAMPPRPDNPYKKSVLPIFSALWNFPSSLTWCE